MCTLQEIHQVAADDVTVCLLACLQKKKKKKDTSQRKAIHVGCFDPRGGSVDHGRRQDRYNVRGGLGWGLRQSCHEVRCAGWVGVVFVRMFECVLCRAYVACGRVTIYLVPKYDLSRDNTKMPCLRRRSGFHRWSVRASNLGHPEKKGSWKAIVGVARPQSQDLCEFFLCVCACVCVLFEGRGKGGGAYATSRTVRLFCPSEVGGARSSGGNMANEANFCALSK